MAKADEIRDRDWTCPRLSTPARCVILSACFQQSLVSIVRFLSVTGLLANMLYTREPTGFPIALSFSKPALSLGVARPLVSRHVRCVLV